MRVVTVASYIILATHPLTTFRELIRDPVAHGIRVVHSDNYTHETIAANGAFRTVSRQVN